MASAPLGLRDRKREETRSRLEEAAVTLVLHDGLEHATVDSISAKADVSSRTFFNYFDTKEDAILGIRDIDLTPEVVAEHLARTDGAGVVESTISLLLAVIRPSIEGAALQKSRIEVLRRYPQLFGRHVVQMTRMVDELVRAVTAILDNDSRSTTPASRAEAEVFLSLCAGAVRTAVKHWIEEGTVEPSESLHPRATALVHSLTERI